MPAEGEDAKTSVVLRVVFVMTDVGSALMPSVPVSLTRVWLDRLSERGPDREAFVSVDGTDSPGGGDEVGPGATVPFRGAEADKGTPVPVGCAVPFDSDQLGPEIVVDGTGRAPVAASVEKPVRVLRFAYAVELSAVRGDLVEDAREDTPGADLVTLENTVPLGEDGMKEGGRNVAVPKPVAIVVSVPALADEVTEPGRPVEKTEPPPLEFVNEDQAGLKDGRLPIAVVALLLRSVLVISYSVRMHSH